jgi:UPF0225 domain
MTLLTTRRHDDVTFTSLVRLRTMWAVLFLVGPMFFFRNSVAVIGGVKSFAPVAPPPRLSSRPSTSAVRSSSRLFAAKKTKKKRPHPPSGTNARTGAASFGGAAMGQCPCGSGDTYSGCCGRLHRDGNAFRLATAEQVVRARYSAYAKRHADFLMASTHPNNTAFDADSKRWRDVIR